ncbi:hypothetical protein [Campylobacter helveticus]|uniref:hypothetical protein n=1 Tax=Campylobacter helveticus TaxID=28898 RepID=UPI0022EB4213|nr:hypothetical protein [Campylobacter helveticus]
MQMYEILDNKGVIHSFDNEKEANKAWDAICGYEDAFESIEEYEKAKEQYDYLEYEGDVKLVKVLAYFR